MVNIRNSRLLEFENPGTHIPAKNCTLRCVGTRAGNIHSWSLKFYNHREGRCETVTDLRLHFYSSNIYSSYSRILRLQGRVGHAPCLCWTLASGVCRGGSVRQVGCDWCRAGHVTTILLSDWSGGTLPRARWSACSAAPGSGTSGTRVTPSATTASRW